MIGTQIGPYEITAKLGEGGMGEVYRATDTKLRREVAIKVLPAAFTEDLERLGWNERGCTTRHSRRKNTSILNTNIRRNELLYI